MQPDDNDSPEYDAALAEVLANLRTEYVSELPSRMHEMHGFLNKAKSEPGKLEHWLAEVHTIAHRLAGTAGSYGFADLSATAANLDLFLKKLLKGDKTSSTPLTVDWQELDALVDAMNKSVPQ